jgi:hypothetical protein
MSLCTIHNSDTVRRAKMKSAVIYDSPVNQNSFWPLQACDLDWWSTFQICCRYLTYNFLNQVLNVLARSKELVDLLRKVELAYATRIYGRPTHSSNVLLDLTPILQEQLQILILHLQPWRAFSFLLWWCVWLLFWRSTDHCDILRRAILLLPIAVFWLLSMVSNLSSKWKTSSCSRVMMNFIWIFQPICDSFCQTFWNGDVIPG